MVTLNPFQIHENLEMIDSLSKYLPAYKASIDGALEGEKENTRSSLRRLGKLKRKCFNNNDGNYPKLLKKLKGINSKIVEEFEKKKIDLPDIAQSDICKNTCQLSTELLSNNFHNSVNVNEEGFKSAVAGGTTGALIALGAYSITGMVGTASTGAAISTLSGAAATNATLAALGGGALSAGGFGVTGGMIAMGAMIALPAILITGLSLGAKSEKALADGKSKLEELRTKEQKVKIDIEKLQQIKKVADLSRSILLRLNNLAERFIPQIENFEKCHSEQFSEKDFELLHHSYLICSLMDGFTKINLITDKDEPDPSAKKRLDEFDIEILKLEVK